MPRASTTYSGDGTIVIGTSVDVGGINTGLQKIEKSFKRLNYLLGGILGVAGFVKLGKAAISVASDLQEVQNIVDVVFEDMSDEVDTFAKNAIYQFGMSELAAKQTAGSFMAMGKAIGVSKEDAKDMSLALTALSGDMASFYNIKQEYARVALSAVYTGETETLKRYGIVLTEANLQEFANAQGIDAQVKKMDARSKAMLRYQYILQQMEFVQGDFVRTSDNWANQVRILQQNWNQFLIVLGNGLITVLTPVLQIINAIIAALIRFSRIVGSILNNIFGIQFQNLADQNAAIADSADSAAAAETELGDAAKGAGKKANKALASWDDLNVLQQNTASGSSAAGGGAEEFEIPDYNVEGTLFDNLKDKLLSDIDTLYGLGEYIGSTLANLLESIDWQYVYSKASAFGSGLAEFLNGLISPELFASVGKTIANSLNTVVTTALSFGQTFDFTDAGLSIAAGINSFFENFNFSDLADTVNTWVQGLFDLMITAITNIDWSNIATKLEEFIANLDLKTVAIIIGTIAIKKIGKFVFFGGLSKILTTALTPIVSKAFGEAFAATTIGTNLTTFATTLGTTFGAIIPIITGVATAVGGLLLIGLNFFQMWQNGFSWLNEAFLLLGTAILGVGLTIAGVPVAIAAAIAGVIAAVATIVIVIHDNWDIITQTLAQVPGWIKTNVIKPVKQFFIDAWAYIKNGFIEAATAINTKFIQPLILWFTNLWTNIVAVWSTVANWFNVNVIQPVVNFFNGFMTRVQAIFQGLWILVQAIWVVASTWFDTNVIQPLSTLFDTLKENVTTFFTNAWNNIVAVWEAVHSWFEQNIFNPLNDLFNRLYEAIRNFFSQAWDKVKEVWEKVTQWFEDNIFTPLHEKWESFVKFIQDDVVAPVQKAWEDATKKIAEFFDTLWTAIKTGVVSAMNGAIGAIENALNFIIDSINSAIEGFNELVEWGADIIGADWEGVATIPRVSLGRVPALAKGGVIPPNAPFMAMLGDQKRGTNIEAPLDTIVQAMLQALGQNNQLGNYQPIVLNIDGQTLARLTLPYNLDELGRRGYNVNVLTQ